MLVGTMLPVALKRLRTIDADAFLPEAAKLLSDPHIGLLVVCAADRTLIGVITKTDVVRQVADRRENLYRSPVSGVMTRNVTYCHPEDPLQDVLSRMRESGFVRFPIVGQDAKPCGVVDARDALQFLLRDAEYDVSLLRDYVMSVGYQ